MGQHQRRTLGAIAAAIIVGIVAVWLLREPIGATVEPSGTWRGDGQQQDLLVGGQKAGSSNRIVGFRALDASTGLVIPNAAVVESSMPLGMVPSPPEDARSSWIRVSADGYFPSFSPGREGPVILFPERRIRVSLAWPDSFMWGGALGVLRLGPGVEQAIRAHPFGHQSYVCSVLSELHSSTDSFSIPCISEVLQWEGLGPPWTCQPEVVFGDRDPGVILGNEIPGVWKVPGAGEDLELLVLPARSAVGAVPGRAFGGGPIALYGIRSDRPMHAEQYHWARASDSGYFVAPGVGGAMDRIRARCSFLNKEGITLLMSKDIESAPGGGVTWLGELSCDGALSLEVQIEMVSIEPDDWNFLAQEEGLLERWDGRSVDVSIIDRGSVSQQRIGNWSSVRVPLNRPIEISGLRPGLHVVDVHLPELVEELGHRVPVRVYVDIKVDVGVDSHAHLRIEPVASEPLAMELSGGAGEGEFVAKGSHVGTGQQVRLTFGGEDSGPLVEVPVDPGMYVMYVRPKAFFESESCWLGVVGTSSGSAVVQLGSGYRLTSDLDNPPAVWVRVTDVDLPVQLMKAKDEAGSWRTSPIPRSAILCDSHGEEMSRAALRELGWW